MCRIVSYLPEHRDGVVAVVKHVFDEYGFTWEAEGYCRDIYEVEAHYLAPGGGFWVVLDAARIVGCAGVRLHNRESELHRLYLLSSHRGRGLGRRLIHRCLAYARRNGCASMRAWSDVKLRDAHRLYLKLGFVPDGQRICDDPDQSRENGFLKEPL